jgi:lipoprotein-anchoring transpeptidase ErfK/SrfK
MKSPVPLISAGIVALAFSGCVLFIPPPPLKPPHTRAPVVPAPKAVIPPAVLPPAHVKPPAPGPAPRPVVPVPPPAAIIHPPVRQPAPPTVATDFRTLVAVQTYLDRKNLSCGCIDGTIGPRSRQAIRAWEIGSGLRPTGQIGDALLARVGAAEQYFTTYSVTEEDLQALTDVPESWEGRAALSRLNFETVLEAVAEKCHASQAAIRRLNPEPAWPNPPAGTVLTIPKTSPSAQVHASRLIIQLGTKTILAYNETGHIVAVFPCSIAARVDKRPVGQLQIVKAAADPDYLFDPELFSDDPNARGIKGKRRIAPGPNNPVGVAWLSLNRPGYGIHGTPHPEDIGKTESHGCFRLANWNARKLLSMVSAGTPVIVDP